MIGMLHPVARPLAVPFGHAMAAAARRHPGTIGTPGAAGFGVGIAPAQAHALGYTPLPGATEPLSANYGNYQYADGSIMVWVPAFRVRLASPDSPRYALYGANCVDVLPVTAHASEAAANAEGYYLHRAFIHAGALQPGFFYDKYKPSNNAGLASSLPLGIPLVSGPQAGQVGFASLAGAPANNLSGTIAAARTRGGQFFPATVFMRDAIAVLATAHAQAATSTAHCAWYDPSGVRSFPLGCNNGGLKDVNDSTLTFASAGSSAQPNMPLTGSASVLAKTTHNGQACGIADVNGTVWDANPGVTTIASIKTITAATKTNPVTLTVAGHGMTTGVVASVHSVAGMTQINDRMYTITVLDADTVSLDGVDGTAFGEYTSGGDLRAAKWYALKPDVDMTSVTSGNTQATDLWGATGVAALYDEIIPAFRTDYPNNVAAQRFGNGANQVFGWDTPDERLLSMCGLPSAGGTSTAGVALFGQDYFYQYTVDQLFVLSGGYWFDGVNAGVRARILYYARTSSSYGVGFVAASYLP